ncbi:MAG: subtilisin family serine protease, partial [Limisphaerales bacterium]
MNIIKIITNMFICFLWSCLTYSAIAQPTLQYTYYIEGIKQSNSESFSLPDQLVNLPSVIASEQAFPGARDPVLKALFIVRSSKEISFGEAIQSPMFCGYSPNDPLFNTEQPDLDYIKAPEAWDLFRSNGEITIGIVDQYVDDTHPDLSGVVLENNSLDTGNFHGTAIAGLAAANSDDGGGMASAGFRTKVITAWGYNPDAEVLALSQRGVKIIVVPWINKCVFSRIQQAVYNEVRENGALVIAAAGNGNSLSGCGDGHDLAYPASLENVLSVSAVGHIRDSISNVKDAHRYWPSDSTSFTYTHNEAVEIVAPGYDLLSTTPTSAFLHQKVWGTSFSAAQVAGAASLVWAANPCMTPDEVESILLQSAVRIDSLPVNHDFIGKLGAGKLDLEAAISLVTQAQNYELSAGSTWWWDGIYLLKDSLVINSGATLRLTGEVHCYQGAKIIVKPGALLEIDGGKIKPACGNEWQGIIVQGLDTVIQPEEFEIITGAYPFDDNDQPVVLIRGNSEITGAGINVKAGGMLLGFDSKIQANCAIEFDEYKLGQKSRFKKMKFIATSDSVYNPLVKVRKNTGVVFEGCKWIGTPDSFKGIGLLMEDGIAFLKDGGCANLSCSEKIKNEFLGFEIGVELIASVGVLPKKPEIRHAFFKNCGRGVLARGIWLLKIEESVFEIPELTSSLFPEANYGIYLEHCRDFQISNNTFYGVGNYGVVINRSGNIPAFIKNNTFENLEVGILTLGSNGDRSGGLYIDCNMFYSNYRDIKICSDFSISTPEPGSIAHFQGYCYGAPATNVFSVAGLNWEADSLTKHVLYSHADDFGMAPIVDSVKVKLNNCGFSPSTIDRTCNWEAPLSGLSDSLSDIDLF